LEDRLAGQPVVAFDADLRRVPHAPGAALARLAATLGDRVTVRTLSALEHPTLVERVGVLTVPATIVVDADGRVRHLNLGYAAEATLHKQLTSVVGSA
jgi:hypothetical protein